MKEDRVLNPYWIATLAKDSGLSIDKGQYLYLTDWGNSRRKTIQDSVQEALNEFGARGAHIDEICIRANEISMRDCTRMTIRQALRSVGAIFDQSTSLWISTTFIAFSDVDDEIA